MSNYTATIEWNRNGEDFINNKYSRAHQWKFDGGAELTATASPHIVPAPWTAEEHIDPEEAFVASLSSCHMLFFLSFASRDGFQIDSYIDKPSGLMSKNSNGKTSMTRVVISPEVVYSGDKRPTKEVEKSLHHLAHENCFIANSVNTEIEINI
ncbi:MAG: peroxiredoxin [Gammaproteobacteria bacterium]|jgi:organic hydroperoxide reductase OsmC/OhrA|nr:peroxiredoxin [Gammaproteobacteria bacterium]MBT3859886.1 peroxiredoxin [Gammaproteobacteria bacterium]MBT3986348.1 peroxiredoxin [Gammaproteobacteria bacterium]MBT4255903.1 peroxiredoxin [Gammaproteobacteria bacterium]MBT4582908.1 peroxiredoxin [Gammaproteobacteria bacterium]